MNFILIAVLVLGAIALIAALVLFGVSKKFAVEEDPRLGQVGEVLPGANCGGCGFAGCSGMAAALVKGADAGSIDGLMCPVGGAVREDFSYAMVHDMKSPLTSIIMGTKYLHSGVLEKKPEMKEKYFCIIEDEAQHLLALINRLLTISKLEHGKLSIQKAEIDLEAMIEDVVDKYKAKSAKPIHITTLFGATSALADEEYLKEAISNIVDNATKYSKEEINIQISTSENDRNVYIKIYDEGIGIARSEMKTIFNRFERAAEHERDARKTRGGFGIGLNYVLQVINAHGGKVSVKSEKGKWSEFTISLPK